MLDLTLVEDALLAVELVLLLVFAQLDQHRAGLAPPAPSHDAVHLQRVARGAVQRQVLAQVGKLVARRAWAQIPEASSSGFRNKSRPAAD